MLNHPFLSVGINSNATLQQELVEFNAGQDFGGLQHFTYNNSGFVDLLYDHLNDTDFDGISVRKLAFITPLHRSYVILNIKFIKASIVLTILPCIM